MEETERSRPRASEEGPGLVATLLGGAVLVLVGFGLGLVVGAARQEPALVFRSLTGEAEPVPADALPAPATPPPAAPSAGETSAKATPPPAAVAERPAAAPAPARPPSAPAKPGPASAVSAAPPAASRVSVQVGSFAEAGQAEKLADRLRRKGFPVTVSAGAGGRDARWRVRVGPFPGRAEADAAAKRLQSEDRLPTWILEDGA